MRDYSPLQRIGLNKAQIICYQSLANVNGGKVSQIAAKAGLSRMTTYRALEELYKKGFVSKTKVPDASASYAAWPIERAFNQFVKYQRRQIAPLLGGYEEFAEAR